MIRFETKLNSGTTTQANKHTFARFALFFVIFSIIIILFGIVGIIRGEDSADRSSGIVLIVVGVLFTPITWIFALIFQKFLNKGAKYISDETDETYAFDDEFLYIKQVSKSMKAEATYKYDYLYKIVESSTHYYLYISKVQYHVVPKNSIIEGDINTQSELLRQKIGKKFSYKRV